MGSDALAYQERLEWQRDSLLHRSTMSPASPDFARAAEQLRQEELSRLSHATLPTRI
jgi:hypothetical protein